MNMLANAKIKLQLLLRPKGKNAFILSLDNESIILDVGCGNDSPARCKKLRPDLYYVGLDIANYNQNHDPNAFANEYLLTSPEAFPNAIANSPSRYDAVICSHNLEHCDDQEATLLSISKSLKIGGRLYLSFPCEASLKFPRRIGTLNFHDDDTHREVPNLAKVLNTLVSRGFQIEYLDQRHRPIFLYILGLIREPESVIRSKVIRGTWEFYGFETIIWARKQPIAQ